ncbi:NADH-quinone oxidoreductase subunit D [bacterium]|nr:NADH-quinone oxidoreductase subunit D [bacterium]
MTITTLKLNLGPQHPSTHGVLRLILELEGEKILSCEPDVGYLHRGMEKMAEKMSYIQYLPVVDRIDYLAGFFYSELYLRNIEKALNIELTPKVKQIRTLCLELNRISSHLLWIGAFLMDLGATSPFFYAMREREMILRFFEKLTGQRMMYNYFIPGGVRRDIDFLEDIEEIVSVLPKKLKDYERIITDNPIFIARTKGKGILTDKILLNHAITGVNLRASGVLYDTRENDYLYDGLIFDTVILKDGDAWARYKARILEIRESINIISQLLEELKREIPLEQNIINPLNIKLPEGEYYSEIEAPRGLASCLIISDGKEKPYRLKWRTGSYYSVNLLREILKENYLNDAIAIAGSLDIILPEVDK